MAFELIAAIVAAIAFAGVFLALNKLLGGRLPKWMMLASAGLGLIGTTIWLEYDWFNRVSAKLPEGIQVVWQPVEAMPLRPWTMAVPITTRFAAMDVREIAQHPNNADLRMARIYSFGRWRAPTDALMVFDCTAGLQILVRDGVAISESGTLTGAEWVSAPEGDGFQATACTQG